MHHQLTIMVTEPTMCGGIWSLAKFYYRDTFHVTKVDIEDNDPALINDIMERERRAQVRGFNAWLATMPRVDEWNIQPESENTNDWRREIRLVIYRASGWFALSDDEAKTEAMLNSVNRDDINLIINRYFATNYEPDDFEENIRFLNDTNPASWPMPRFENMVSIVHPGYEEHLAPSNINRDCVIPAPRPVDGYWFNGERLAALYGSPARAMIVSPDNRNDAGEHDGRPRDLPRSGSTPAGDD